MPIEPISTEDCILGYTLKERIGMGGYGEVWRAEAPGGIQKAIKLIYGFHDENRAQAELKSLNRIKQVRHPFLLSLERIDVVDSRLAVVTELADKCLSDRFQECIDQGLRGIPREELLAYLRDAADALDFMSESHSLQHLDIKPANLLLVGNHVKVADFGLVKDIHDATQSLMSGLTPTYAPPELFDGRPSRSSDQYSVAIVYQEMLTGTRPFDGSTAAQLASQHVHGDPNVEALPRGDQNVVLRALEKQPGSRYDSCHTLVEELASRTTKTKVRKPKKVRKAAPAVQVKPANASDATMELPEESLMSSSSAPTITRLDALEADCMDATVRPTIFIGVGQTATNVLRRLRRRLHERLGDRDAIPSLRILCIDTDARDLTAASRGQDSSQLSIDETLPIPLRRPEEYRSDAKMHLSWLSRRWIYNVPRSLQTEGIRPLGRLAFADHHEKISARVHDLIEAVSLPEAMARTAETTELNPLDAGPQVFIVASIAGGVGSGMVVDLAYAVRTALLERGLSDDSVYGVLAHSSGRSASERDLTVANAFSCLSEMNHYSGAAGYPGDETCGLPAFDEYTPTFAGTYVVDLGSDLRQDEFEAATDNLAEFLYLNAATRSGAFFEACRSQTPEYEETNVRTFGLCQTATIDGDIASTPSHVLAHRLIEFWSSDGCDKTARPVNNSVGQELLDGCGVSLNKIMTRFDAILDSRGEPTTRQLVDDVLSRTMQRSEQIVREHDWVHVFHEIEAGVDKILTIDSAGTHQNFASLDDDGELASIVDYEIQSQIETYSKSITDVVLGALDYPGQRLNLAFEACHQVREQIDQLAEESKDLRRRTQEDLAEVARKFTEAASDQAGAGKEFPSTDAAIRDYGQLRLREFVLTCTVGIVMDLDRSTERLLDQLRDVQRTFRDISGALDQIVQDGQRLASLGSHGEEQWLSRLMLKNVTGDIDELCSVVDGKLQEGFLSAEGGLRQLVCQSRWPDRLEDAIRRTSREVVTDVFRRVDLDRALNAEKVDDNQLAQWWQRRLELAAPRLLATCGGACRLMIAVPEGGTAKELVRSVVDQFQEKPTLVRATYGDIDVCYEVGEVPLASIANQLIQARPDCLEYVSRLHTRTDVSWTPLVRMV